MWIFWYDLHLKTLVMQTHFGNYGLIWQLWLKNVLYFLNTFKKNNN